MIPKPINLLIVEDHALIVEGYANILKGMSDFVFRISNAPNCDQAVVQLDGTSWDLVLLDLRIPASSDLRFTSGEDLAKHIRTKRPSTKIIVVTAIVDYVVVANIVNEFKPEGFLIKSDIGTNSVSVAINAVLEGQVFYSKTVQNYIDKKAFHTMEIDDVDRQILYWMSMGLKIKDISGRVALSERAVEVRKRKLTDLLVNDSDEASNLIIAAKNKGII